MNVQRGSTRRSPGSRLCLAIAFLSSGALEVTCGRLEFACGALALADEPPAAAAPDPTDVYASRIQPILDRYCTGCHNADRKDEVGSLDLTSFEQLVAGGENGSILVPAKSSASRLVGVIVGRNAPRMPPGRRARPTAEDIAVLEAWIDAGARGPLSTSAASPLARVLSAPAVPAASGLPRAVQAVACDPRRELVAIARHGQVELHNTGSPVVLRSLEDLPGPITAVAFSSDGRRIVAAGGQPGVGGEARLWDAENGRLLGAFSGHRDSLYAATLSADGALLATGSYDDTIKIWDAQKGDELRTLTGHNGAVFDLAFRRDGKVLASASDDWTGKLWNVETGERLDTFSEPLKEVYAVAFSADGARVAAGGADHRLRVWEVSEGAAEGTNHLLVSRFAHEGTILEIAYSPRGDLLVSAADDHTVKIWDAKTLTERHVLERQSDWVTGIAFAADGRTLIVGRQDGSVGYYDVETGLPALFSRAELPARGSPRAGSAAMGRGATGAGAAGSGAAGLVLLAGLALLGGAEEPAAPAEPPKPPPRPAIRRLEPRSVQRGVTTRVRVVGEALAGVVQARTDSAGVALRVAGSGEDRPEEEWIEVKPDADRSRGPIDIRLATAGGESERLQLHVDDIELATEIEPNDAAARAMDAPILPAGLRGTIAAPGDVDCFRFRAEAGRTIVLDVAAQRLGSNLDAVLVLRDSHGMPIDDANNHGGMLDPLIAFTVPETGAYVAEIHDLNLGGSDGHDYVLSVGELPIVTSVFPLSGAPGSTIDVELVGYNLPAGATTPLHLGASGATPIAVDSLGYRSRRSLQVKSGLERESVEIEPNDAAAAASPLEAPAGVCGRFVAAAGKTSDVDCYRFRAAAGQVWIIEIEAERLGSPVDTRIAVLHAGGRPVRRVLLQATRDSFINWKPIDADNPDVRVKSWEEMELNELLYFRGEVVKILRMPQGPDSGFLLYRSPEGRRRTFFDTTATAHANLSVCYTVVPLAPGDEPVPNGLPVFPIDYENDDDAERRNGKDSRLTFTAPEDAEYIVRVEDVAGGSGDDRSYRLIMREAQPEFRPAIEDVPSSVGRGSGRPFRVRVDRIDGFDGEVRFDIEGAPKGFLISTPLVVEAGHSSASGVIFVTPGAEEATAEAWQSVRITARATVGGTERTKDVGQMPVVAIGQAPELTAALEPVDRTSVAALEPGSGSGGPAAAAQPMLELTIRPGAETPALLRVRRNGHKDLVTFTVDNLPHGVIVNDIGLNGVLIPAEESERQIFLHCARWVGDMDRICYALASQAGGQASYPVLLRVRR